MRSVEGGRGPIEAVGLVARNSVPFVSAVLRLYQEHRSFVPLRSVQAADELTATISLTGIEQPSDEPGWFSECRQPEHGTDLAQINFTSGSTGTPKGVLLAHDSLAYTTGQLIEVQQLTSEVREYVAVPPIYSFGLGRFRACAAVGGRAYIPANGHDPAEIGQMLRAGQINALSAVPTMLRVLIAHADLVAHSGKQMRWIEIGSQHMSRHEKEQLKSIFPEARIVQHYGLTEASRSTFLDVSVAEGRVLDSVGCAISPGEVAVGDDGRISVRGPHVARQWLRDGRIEPITDPDGWLKTNDLGEMEDGQLIFRGRSDDLINFGGVKLVPELIEAGLRDKLGRERSFAVSRIGDALRGDGVLVAVDDGEPLEEVRQATIEVLATSNLAAGSGLRVEAVAEIPRTATGKVQRALLSQQFEADGAEAAVIPLGDDDPSVLRLFGAVFPRHQLRPADCFDSLPGDSLAHISLAVALEEYLGTIPDGWEEMSIAELEALAPADARPTTGGLLSVRSLNVEVLLRAIAVTTIVAHHAFGLDLSGGIDIFVVLLGVSMARFQITRLASPERWGILRDVFVRMVLPYYALISAYALSSAGSVTIGDYLLISNFEGRFQVGTVVYWFIPAYVQAVLFFVAAASLPAVRRAMVQAPGEFGALFLTFAIVVKVVALLLFRHHHLVGRTPDQFLYLIALGWCLQFARTPTTRIQLMLVAGVIAVLDLMGPYRLWSGFDGRWHGLAMLGTLALLMYLPSVKLPNVIRSVVLQVGMASLVIYFTHQISIHLLRDHLHALGVVAVSLVAGVSCSHLIGWWMRRLPKKELGPPVAFEF